MSTPEQLKRYKMIGTAGVIVIPVMIILIATIGISSSKTGISDMLPSIENYVAQDAIKQYEIAKRQGDKVQIYVSAGLVSAAFLQAKDEENYIKWKAIEKEAGKAAGINFE